MIFTTPDNRAYKVCLNILPLLVDYNNVHSTEMVHNNFNLMYQIQILG